jgi:hypothetical protein
MDARENAKNLKTQFLNDEFIHLSFSFMSLPPRSLVLQAFFGFFARSLQMGRC